MKRLAIVSVLALLAAGLFFHASPAKSPAKSDPVGPRAEWRDAPTKHWRAIILRKD